MKRFYQVKVGRRRKHRRSLPLKVGGLVPRSPSGFCTPAGGCRPLNSSMQVVETTHNHRFFPFFFLVVDRNHAIKIWRGRSCTKEVNSILALSR